MSKDRYTAVFRHNHLRMITAEISSCMRLFQRRSQIHTSTAHFHHTFLDAHEIRNMDPPQSPLGYFCLGDACKQQAVDMYTLGIKTALSNHPSYPLLIKANEAAAWQQEKCVDFIAQNIVTFILQQEFYYQRIHVAIAYWITISCMRTSG